MQQTTIPRLFMVQRLYRRVLKLHRALPTELKKLGDEYAKDEFRRNRSANQLQAFEFMTEWKVCIWFYSYFFFCCGNHRITAKGRNFREFIQNCESLTPRKIYSREKL